MGFRAVINTIFYLKILNYLYLWLHWVFIATHGLLLLLI